MQRKRLGQTDLEVSVLGFGAAPLGGEYGAIDVDEAERAVHFAIDRGINFLDTAPYYGRTLSEERLGKALGGRRQEVLIATKCSRYGLDDFDFSAKRVEASIDQSLRRLRTDYVDLYQIHDIEFGDLRQVIEEAVPAARKVQQAGKARYIGITGLQLKALRRVAEAAPVDTILSYARYNLMARDLDDLMTPFAKERGIGLINASPLHLRVLTPLRAPEWHPASPEVKEIGRRGVKRAPKLALRGAGYEPAPVEGGAAFLSGPPVHLDDARRPGNGRAGTAEPGDFRREQRSRAACGDRCSCRTGLASHLAERASREPGLSPTRRGQAARVGPGG